MPPTWAATRPYILGVEVKCPSRMTQSPVNPRPLERLRATKRNRCPVVSSTPSSPWERVTVLTRLRIQSVFSISVRMRRNPSAAVLNWCAECKMSCSSTGTGPPARGPQELTPCRFACPQSCKPQTLTTCRWLPRLSLAQARTPATGRGAARRWPLTRRPAPRAGSKVRNSANAWPNEARR